MFRVILCGLAITILSTFLFGYHWFLDERNVPKDIDGVYEFLSERTVLTAPRQTAYERTATEWTGLWQMQNGYYTRILMKSRRDRFFDAKNLNDFGFESYAGPYELGPNTITLVEKYAFNPLAVGHSESLKYRIEGDKLTLIEELHPYVEDLREGTITTVLRRVK